MQFLKELKLSEDGKEMYMRNIHPLTRMPIDNWILLTDKYYEYMREEGKRTVISEFKSVFNDLWHITPSHQLPELLRYYKQKMAFFEKDEYFLTLQEFKVNYIQEMKQRFSL